MVRNKCVTKNYFYNKLEVIFFFYNVTKAYWLHINKCKNEF